MAIDDQRFEIDGTQFNVKKLGAIEGFRLLEYIRHAIGTTDGVLESLGSDVSTVLGDDGKPVEMNDSFAVAAANLFGRLDPKDVEHVRQVLFQQITFTNAQAIDPLALAGVEDMAFTDPAAIYEVTLRGLAVSFLEPLRKRVSGLPNVDLRSLL